VCEICHECVEGIDLILGKLLVAFPLNALFEELLVFGVLHHPLS
jgi:hypothetical protein